MFARPKALTITSAGGKEITAAEQQQELLVTRALMQRLGLQSGVAGEGLVQQHLYICPQSLMKFHPSFDRTMLALLEEDRHAKIVLVYNTRAHTLWKQTLEARLIKSMGPAQVLLIDCAVDTLQRLSTPCTIHRAPYTVHHTPQAKRVVFVP
jgi:hypothetical protein